MVQGVIILMRANPLQGPLEGLGPENPEFFGPLHQDFFLALKWQRARTCHLGP
jgi:hypothetical protein